MKILITGSRGQLGRAINQVLQPEYIVYPWDKEELDFTDSSKTYQLITELNPAVIIHCGAYTDVPGCELSPEKAFLINSAGTRNIVNAAAKCDATLVYISTDYVFDGKKGAPYHEFDQPNPLNVYGQSKLAGEEIIKTLLENFYIIRTSWLFSKEGKNFVKTILRLVKEKEELMIVHDQVGAPTFADDLAKIIKEIIIYPFYGVYHISNSGFCSWYEFAREIVRLKDFETYIKPISSREYGDIAKRPEYSVLNNFNLGKTFGIQMRDWRSALEECLSGIKE